MDVPVRFLVPVGEVDEQPPVEAGGGLQAGEQRLHVVGGVIVEDGGVGQPPNLSAMASERFSVPARKVVIADFVPEQKHNPTDAVWSSDFHPLPNNSTVPPFTDLVLQSLKTRLSGRGGDQSGLLEIAVLNANLLMESHVADSIAFVGIASSFSARKYMCRVDVNFRYADKSVRKAFEAIDSKTRAWSDLQTNEKAAMVEKCLDHIVRDIADFSVEVIER